MPLATIPFILSSKRSVLVVVSNNNVRFAVGGRRAEVNNGWLIIFL